MKWLPLIAVLVAWLSALLAVIAVRGKQLSAEFCILVLLCSSLGAGVVQYCVFAGMRTTERLSAADLVVAASLQLKDQAAFIQQYLMAKRDRGNEAQEDAEAIDWNGTFRMRADDVSETLTSVLRNDFLRANYSVFTADIEFRRNQLDRVARRVAMLPEGKPRQTTVDFYMEYLELAADQLDRHALEMRLRSPEASYD